MSNLSLVHRVRRWRRALVLLAGLVIPLTPGIAYADAVIGDGTPASCQTEQAANNFRIAVEAGGVVSFNCGSSQVSLTVDTGLVTQATVVNGGGRINLNAEGLRQHFYVTGSGNLTLNDVTLFDGGGSTGGAIFVDTQATVTFNNGYIVSSNSGATSGGSIYNRGTLILNNVEVGASNAGVHGGAIYNAGGSVTLHKTTLRNNEAAQRGGGIYSAGGSLTLTNSTIGENRAQGGGGLFLTGGAATTILNVTFGLNRADTGGALWNFSGTTSTKNSIFAMSLQRDGVTPQLNCDGATLTSQGRNVVDDGSCIAASANDKRNTDAKLGGFDLNGGVGATFAPLVDSPALDYALDCPASDQRDYPRPLGAGCDAGAVERGALIFLGLVQK
jgi:predicted outer membrane repeat protein